MVTSADIDATVAEIEALRGPLDVACRAETRQLDNELFPPILKAIDDGLPLADIRVLVADAFFQRATPGPATSADKRLHENERKFGSACKQAVTRLKSKL